MRDALWYDGVQYNLKYAEELTSRFWALFISSKVEKDATVPGFKAFWDRMTPNAQDQADRYCHWTWRKVQRDGRDPDECIAAGVKSLREAIRLYQVPSETPPPSREEVARLVAVLVGVFEEPTVMVHGKGLVGDRPPLKLTESQVAEAKRQAQELLAAEVPPPMEG